jgi:hypothetical protein
MNSPFSPPSVGRCLAVGWRRWISQASDPKSTQVRSGTHFGHRTCKYDITKVTPAPRRAPISQPRACP